MSRRYRWAISLALVAFSILAGIASRQGGPAALAIEPANNEVASLKDQLEKGLRVLRSVEFEFVRRVAQLVENKQLSLELVQGSFSWTLKKYERRKYMVPYFEQVLRRRAKADKITVLDNIPTTLPKL